MLRGSGAKVYFGSGSAVSPAWVRVPGVTELGVDPKFAAANAHRMANLLRQITITFKVRRVVYGGGPYNLHPRARNCRWRRRQRYLAKRILDLLLDAATNKAAGA